jgi:hypothetical protein
MPPATEHLVEANQGDTLDALRNCFAQLALRPPAAEATDKRRLTCSVEILFRQLNPLAGETS